jgi:hypothetical protein
MMPTTQLASLLVEAGILDHEDVVKFIAGTEDHTPGLRQWLARQDGVLQEQVAQAFCLHMGIPVVDVSRIDLPKSIVRLVPRDIVVESHAVPMSITQFNGQRILYVAFFDPTDFEAVARVSSGVEGMTVKPVAATYMQIQMAIDKFWPEDDGRKLPWEN